MAQVQCNSICSSRLSGTKRLKDVETIILHISWQQNNVFFNRYLKGTDCILIRAFSENFYERRNNHSYFVRKRLNVDTGENKKIPVIDCLETFQPPGKSKARQKIAKINLMYGRSTSKFTNF